MFILKILAAWCVISVVVGLVIGTVIADAQDDHWHRGGD